MHQPKESKPTSAPNETVIFDTQIPAGNTGQSGIVDSAQMVGKTVGKYEITGILGVGGMGVVLKARDPMLEREVAVKILPQELAGDEIALRRFLAEAKAAGKLHHPNVVSIYEIGQEGQTYFLVLELASGGSAADRIERAGAYSPLEATRTMIDACQGIGAAHAVGLIHRDIKPANLMHAEDGTVKVSDFGLVKAVSSQSQGMTEVGQVVGTPYFMSPEQCESRTIDLRSDIYSLGATYYCLLTGKYPYEESGSAMQIMYAHCHKETPDPRAVNPAIPEACAAIIAIAMAKAPQDRYPSTAEMLADLQTVAATLSGTTPINLPSSVGRTFLSVGAAGTDKNVHPTGAAGTDKNVHPTGATGTDRNVHPTGDKRRWPLWLGNMFVLVALLFIALMLWRPWESEAVLPVAPGGPPIKVGVLHSLSGTMRDSESAVVNATLFAIDEINQAGGLLGRPVEAIVADGRSDGPTFATEAARLITEEKVCTVFGCWTSESRKSVLPIFEEHDHLLIYPLQFEGLETSPNVFYMGAAPNQQILPAVRWAVEQQQKQRFFLVGSDYVFPRCAHEIIKDYLKTVGATVVGEHYLPLGGQKVDPVIKQIAEAKPDIIINTINGDTNRAFFRTLRTAGIKSSAIPTLSFSIGEHELRSFKVADVQGDYAAWTYFQSLDTPANTKFVQDFQKKYPQHAVTDPMESAYVGVKLWAQAVAEADSTDPVMIRRALLHQRLESPGGPIRIDPTTQYCFKIPRVGQINGQGQFAIVWSESKAAAPVPYPDTRTARDWQVFLNDLYRGWGERWAAPDS